ncbi:glycosyltransferase family 4 protein [Roseofilum sp. BLCC_M154]|uniref:Glycosyltransferase family 4 protein n=1 Tax=Roseofilum acuticapitatum BLCC-M154 TaxID=3022444 RepID=A0ABT7ARR5_9CYAN|nr:glycosyltransferase family 4 protein [Roseofilum acuticapitatum]MDJ1169591.1 glycosyltransferase family 4 protein [Roseofilum acuticapitatum BLCC-M154]
MKVTLLSRSDVGGGASVAVRRLYYALNDARIDATLLVGNKNREETVLVNDSKVGKARGLVTRFLDNLPIKTYDKSSKSLFSVQWVPDEVSGKLKILKPDVVNLHWISQGFMQVETLAQLPYPLVWTSHDMWGFTGGCHYTEGCDRYLKSCGQCPQLNSSKDNDLSRWIWQRKAKAWCNLPLTIVTPSHWLADCARNSSLFANKRIEVIPNGLNTKIYKPMNRRAARERLNLPADKHLVLFGALNPTSDPRKGFQYLEPALKSLSQSDWKDKIELVIFGASRPEQEPELGFKIHYLGQFKDDVALSLIYASVDLFVAPSVQDNLPNTIMESMACGTPVVAFKIGGIPDMIEHENNGYLAQPFESEDLAQGMGWILQDQERYNELCDRARRKVEQEFTLEIQAKNYLDLFTELIDNYHKE